MKKVKDSLAIHKLIESNGAYVNSTYLSKIAAHEME
jgi:hypothetical protein